MSPSSTIRSIDSIFTTSASRWSVSTTCCTTRNVSLQRLHPGPRISIFLRAMFSMTFSLLPKISRREHAAQRRGAHADAEGDEDPPEHPLHPPGPHGGSAPDESRHESGSDTRREEQDHVPRGICEEKRRPPQDLPLEGDEGQDDD